MKKTILATAITLIFFQFLSAQYCGNSGPGVCTPVTLTQPGFSPSYDSLPPLINGQTAATTIHFQNFNTFSFSGTIITIQSLGFDSITNLPAGLCWATNKTTNIFGNQENGCIQLSGTTCSAPGQYRLGIYVAAGIGVGNPIHMSAAAVGLFYYLRVNNAGDAVTAIDTTGQAVS